jgi:hypothetical protein
MDKSKMTKEIIKKVEIFDDFSYYQPHLINIGKASVGQEINFKGGANQTIAISNKKHDRIWFGITNDVFNSKIIKLTDEGCLDFEQLLELSSVFEFDIENHPYSNKFNRGVANKYSPLYIVFQWVLGRFYCLIYGARGNTNFADDILYIHGIWEVELAEEFKKKVFG